nr:MAG TPA: hypothetical protein [Caudoviricetes sp.]
MQVLNFPHNPFPIPGKPLLVTHLKTKEKWN